MFILKEIFIAHTVVVDNIIDDVAAGVFFFLYFDWFDFFVAAAVVARK